jgi:enolase
VEKKAGNALRIVVGQTGTVTEAALIAQTAYEFGFGASVCGERGDGIDACDYAVALNAGTAREYGMGYSGNRFLQIEKELGPRARFLGKYGLKGARFAL